MRRAWEDWLAAECAAHPVLLVLEDLHWGDLGTVSFIDAALRNLRDAAAHGAGAGAPRRPRPLPRPVAGARAADRSAWARCPSAPARSWCARRSATASATPSCERARRARRRQRLLPRGADPRRGRRAARESLPETVLGHGAGAPRRRGARGASACCARRRLRRALLARGRGGAAGRRGASSRDVVATALERLAARELVARAATRRAARTTSSSRSPRAGARGGLRDADRRRSRARPPAGRRVAGAGGRERRDGAGRALPARRRAGARGRAGTSAPPRRRCGPTTSAPRSSAPSWGSRAAPRGEAAGALRLIQAEAHVWRGELGEAERAGAGGGRDAAAGQRRLAARPGAGDHRRRQARAAGRGRARRCGWSARRRARPTPAARNAQIVCLSWAANYLMFGGRIDGGRRAHGRASPSWRATSREIEPQALALVHQVRAARASAAGDLGALPERARVGAAGVRAGGRPAQRLRGAHQPRLPLLRARRLPARRGGAAPGAGRRRPHGPPRPDGGRAAQPGARARPARRARPRRERLERQAIDELPRSRAIRAWRGWRAPTWPRS